MKKAVLTCLSLATAVAIAQLFWGPIYLNGGFDWFGSSYRANDLGNVHYYYTFGYVLVFTVAGFFRWPVSFRRQALATGIALLGGILPLVSVCFRYYLNSHWLIADVFYLEKDALPSLLVAHGVILFLLNMLLFMLKKYGGLLKLNILSGNQPSIM